MKKRIVFELFTDASSYNNGCKIPYLPQHSLSAGILVHDRKVVAGFSKFNPDTTNSYGELFAIYYSLKKTFKLLKKMGVTKADIILHSDSNVCVSGLKYWMPNWKKNERNGIWYSSKGPVINQELFKEIDKQFLDREDYRVKIIHTRGHINLSSRKDIEKAYKSFVTINRFDIPIDRLIYMLSMNNIVDRYAVAKLRQYEPNYRG